MATQEQPGESLQASQWRETAGLGPTLEDDVNAFDKRHSVLAGIPRTRHEVRIVNRPGKCLGTSTRTREGVVDDQPRSDIES